jgi:hypothetical protein
MLRRLSAVAVLLVVFATMALAVPSPNCTEGNSLWSNWTYWGNEADIAYAALQDATADRVAAQVAVSDHMAQHCNDPETCGESPSLQDLLDDLQDKIDIEENIEDYLEYCEDNEEWYYGEYDYHRDHACFETPVCY